MPDIQVTDQLDQKVDTIKIDLSHPSSLVKYLRTELLHLAVFPDFLARKDSTLSQAAPTKPIQFDAKAQHEFQIGHTTPEIDVTPAAHIAICVNASPGTNLFDGDPFHVPAKVPDRTGYLSVSFEGTVDAAVSGSEGDLCYGFDKTATVGLGYWKAFPLGLNEPTLGNALGQTLSSYVTPADLADLDNLGVNDIATLSGQGSLKVSGGVSVSVSPNPLASVDLPLGAGTIAVKAGATAGLTASFTIKGSYQVRVCRKDAGTIELSVLRESGTTWKIDWSASAGVTAKVAGTDVIAPLLGAISTDPEGDKKLMADLQPAEAAALAAAIKGGLDHSLQASLDVALSALADDQAAFRYEIQTALLTDAAKQAVNQALHGDLTLLTAMEDDIQAGGVLAPGLKMLDSLFTETRKSDTSLKINLLGILNYLTVSELLRNSETLTDAVTGDITIKETVTGTRISAVIEPLARNEALRKAIFDSVLATASYRAGKAVALPSLSCRQVHFALNQNTNHQILADYLRGFTALNLLTDSDRAASLSQFHDGGPSTCVLRTSFGDPECEAMFFDASGSLHPRQFYLEIGRRALQELLDPDNQAIDRLRSQILNDSTWPTALTTGANVNLGPLAGLSTADVQVSVLVGDMVVITDWADAMVQTGALVQDLRKFVGAADPASLFQNGDFAARRANLQKKMAAMVKASKTRFDEPWGMICLFQAAGFPHTAYANTVAQKFLLERGSKPAAAVVPV